MENSNKTTKILAIILVLGGLVAGVFGIERYMSASEDDRLSLENSQQAEEFEAAGDIINATDSYEWAAELAESMNSKRTISYIALGGAFILIIGGIILFKRR